MDSLNPDSIAGRQQRVLENPRIPLITLSQLIALLMIPLMLVSIWLRIQVLDNDRYSESMRDLGSDASFQDAFSDQVSRLLNNEITLLANTSYAALAASYVEAAGGVEALTAIIVDGVTSLIQSPLFVDYWVQLNQATHQQVVDFLEGRSSVIVADNRRGISLDLGLIASWVDPFVDGAASDVLALATSDGVAQFPIAESKSFPAAEWMSRNSLPVAIGSSAIFIVLQTLVIVLSRNRRQAVFLAAIGIAVVAAATMLATKTVISDHLSRIRDAGGRSLAREYVDALMSDLVLLAFGIAAGALVIGIVLAVLPYVRRESGMAAVSPSMPQA
ncbi:MAG: hypothetical protein ACRDHN_17950 [Thermomicrobiales bacterium]